MPLVADLEPSIESDLAARELTRTEFDFLSPCWAGFVRRAKCMFAALNRGSGVDVIAALMNW